MAGKLFLRIKSLVNGRELVYVRDREEGPIESLVQIAVVCAYRIVNGNKKHAIIQYDERYSHR